MTIIGFEAYKIRCIIGVYPEERKTLQDIFVDLRVRFDFVSRNDALHETLDYVVLAELCQSLAEKKQYQLLETFAADTLDKLFEAEKIQWAFIRVKKPRALPNAQFAFVEMERHR